MHVMSVLDTIVSSSSTEPKRTRTAVALNRIRAIDSALTQCILRGGAGLGVLRSDLRINSHLGFFENSYELGD